MYFAKAVRHEDFVSLKAMVRDQAVMIEGLKKLAAIHERTMEAMQCRIDDGHAKAPEPVSGPSGPSGTDIALATAIDTLESRMHDLAKLLTGVTELAGTSTRELSERLDRVAASVGMLREEVAIRAPATRSDETIGRQASAPDLHGLQLAFEQAYEVWWHQLAEDHGPPGIPMAPLSGDSLFREFVRQASQAVADAASHIHTLDGYDAVTDRYTCRCGATARKEQFEDNANLLASEAVWEAEVPVEANGAYYSENLTVEPEDRP